MAAFHKNLKYITERMGCMNHNEETKENSMDFNVPFTAYGGLCITAASEEEAYQKAKKKLDNGELDDFIENISENVGNIDLQAAMPVD